MANRTDRKHEMQTIFSSALGQRLENGGIYLGLKEGKGEGQGQLETSLQP